MNVRERYTNKSSKQLVLHLLWAVLCGKSAQDLVHVNKRYQLFDKADCIERINQTRKYLV